MKYGIFDMIRDQVLNPIPPVATKNLEGRTVIVTGANVGLGFEAAKHFARMNPGRLIIVCRDQKRGAEALAKIRQDTGYNNIELWLMDLASFASVNAFADRFEKDGGRLDILLENAGISPTGKLEFTNDGWEPVLQVNHLSTSLLGLLLLPHMLETARKYQTTPRLVVVSSGVHYWTKIEEVVTNSENPLRMFGCSPDYVPKVMKYRYQDSKLMNVFFTRALNDRLKGQPIIVNAVTPGYAYSSLRRNLKGILAVFDWIMEKAIAITTEEGSRQLIWASVSDSVKPDDLRGAFILGDRVVEPSDYVISKEGVIAQNILWDNLIDELVQLSPKVARIAEEHLRHPTSERRLY